MHTHKVARLTSHAYGSTTTLKVAGNMVGNHPPDLWDALNCSEAIRVAHLFSPPSNKQMQPARFRLEVLILLTVIANGRPHPGCNQNPATSSARFASGQMTIQRWPIVQRVSFVISLSALATGFDWSHHLCVMPVAATQTAPRHPARMAMTLLIQQMEMSTCQKQISDHRR